MAINKLRGTKNADGTTVVLPTRTGSYGEAYILPVGVGRYTWSDEGSYFVAQNATMGTALTGHVAPAIADTNTKSIIHGYNSGTKDIYLDYIALTCPVANANATAVYFATWTDSKGATGLTSGGTAITSVYNTRSDSTATSGLNITAGPCVTAPVTNIKRMMMRQIKPYIGVALDSYTFVFGDGAQVPKTGYALVTAVTNTVTHCAPFVLAPGGNLYFVQTGPTGSATAMTFEFEMGWSER
jgi:hypothetical protein